MLVSAYEVGLRYEYQRALTRIISSFILAVGYCSYVIGIAAPAWKRELGYVHGLWVRCDLGVCEHYFTGFSDYLSLVRCGIIISLFLLTAAIICLLLETTLKSAEVTNKHTERIAKVLSITAAVGEIVAALSLTLYGSLFIIGKKTLPVLCWGFALTGTSVIFLLLGSILRAMGPPLTWGQQGCCLAPKREAGHNLVYVCSSASSRSETFNNRQNLDISGTAKDKGKVDLLSCFHKSKLGYIYSSIPSTRSSSLERGYRHYEEISFDDMPPPPLELLQPLPPVNPSLHFNHESLPAYPETYPEIHDYPVVHHRQHLPLHAQVDTVRPLQHLQQAAVTSQTNVEEPDQGPSHAVRRKMRSSTNRSRVVCGHKAPLSSPPSLSRTVSNQPPIRPRHTVKSRPPAKPTNPKPRNKPRSQTVSSTLSNHCKSASAANTRYQSMPVKPTRRSAEKPQNVRGSRQTATCIQDSDNMPNLGTVPGYT